MTLCPIALAVGCRKCPAVNVCPVKSILGDYKEGKKGDKSETDSSHIRKKESVRWSPEQGI